jgi:hypothetical protein
LVIIFLLFLKARLIETFEIRNNPLKQLWGFSVSQLLGEMEKLRINKIFTPDADTLWV